jgi:hypothetical protein
MFHMSKNNHNIYILKNKGEWKANGSEVSIILF